MFVNRRTGKKIQARAAGLWPTDFLFVSDMMLPLATNGGLVSERTAPLSLV